MDWKMISATIFASVAASSLLGGLSGFWTVSQNTLVNTKDVEAVKEDVQELKQNDKEQQQLLYQILREVKK